ncbi:unnamed protein product, partial [Staurois parvus]
VLPVPPFAATAVSHQTPDINYLPEPGHFHHSLMGRRTVLFTNSPPPCQLRHTALSSVITVKHRHPPPSKTLPAHS